MEFLDYKGGSKVVYTVEGDYAAISSGQVFQSTYYQTLRAQDMSLYGISQGTGGMESILYRCFFCFVFEGTILRCCIRLFFVENLSN